jgi:polyferredoxin
MSKSYFTKRRRIIQGLSMAVLLSIPLRFFCFDLEGDCIRLYGTRFGLSTMFYPLFGIVALLLFVIGMGMKKGRIFCSHLCPMHMFLETINRSGKKSSTPRKGSIWLWAVFWSVFLTQVILSFFLSTPHQARLFASGNLTLIGVASAFLLGFLGLFIHYREKFCKRGCPYALIQMLLQSDSTRFMQFDNADRTCTNCRSCDDICPFNLRARFESNGADCTNCNLCSEACTNELGQGNTLFHFVDPDPEDD